MNRKERNLRPLPQRLTSAVWPGIFGQCASCLTEPIALLDRKRLRHHFLAYWGLSLHHVELDSSSDGVSAKERAALKFRVDSQRGGLALGPRSLNIHIVSR